ncbi:MAG: metal-sensing transcriptional repressor [Acutalibacteraceae bacterium]
MEEKQCCSCNNAKENTENSQCCHYKNTPRTEEEQKLLQNRINRIIGQLGGIKNMIDDNRYCGDILIQISAVESALKSLGYIIMQNHLETCVAEQIKNGNDEIIKEVMELFKRFS